jgi:polar amino acid transport system substrate-binding protein
MRRLFHLAPWRLPRILSLTALLYFPVACLAADARLALRICTFDQPYPPLMMPDGSGQAQELLRRGANNLPLAISQVILPRPECLSRVRSGEADATMAAFVPERLEYCAYPMQGLHVDEGGALGVLRFMVFRRRDSDLGWDGHRFSNLGRQPVGVQTGFLHGALLRQMGVVLDEGSSSTETNLAKLAQSRVAAVIGMDGEGDAVITQKYRDQIETLPDPFHLTPVYLAVNRQYYLAHKGAIDAYWSALRQVRQSSDYQHYLARAR